MSKRQYTGRELEEKGVMKFDCPACRDAFPARCEAHPVRNPHVLGRVRGHLIVRTEPRRPREAETSGDLERSSTRPMLAYTPPYEHLEREIQSVLAAARAEA